MKVFTTLALLLISSAKLFSQSSFFTSIVAPSELTAAKLVPAGLQQNYRSTTYFKQLNFAPTQKFLLRLDAANTIEVNESKWLTYTNGAVSFVGKVANDDNSSVVFSKFQNRWHGMITDGNLQKFIVQQTDDETYAVSKIEEQTYINQDKKDDFIEVPTTAASTANFDVCDASNPCTINGVVIDLMVAYTPAAATVMGGTASIVSSITTAVTNMNTANTNAGVNSNISFNLVHTYEVVYTESGATSTDLSRLRSTTDGFMDDIHTQRTVYSADLVSLIVASPTNTCGIGYLNPNPTNYSADNGFNVTVYNCVVGNYSMAHELGHNMGLNHDWHVSAATTPCSHHHGYVNQEVIATGGLPTTARWRTILAYNDQCSANGFSCSRINHWSNPNVLRAGDAMGVDLPRPNPAYETYGINRFACVISAFLGANVLPLSLNNFAVNYYNNKLNVSWVTQNENGIRDFEIQTALKTPQNFTSNATIPAKNKAQASYFESINWYASENVFVRLKYTDVDGRVKYTEPVNVKVSSQDAPKLQSSVLNNTLSIQLYNKNAVTYSISVLGADGKLFASYTYNALPGQSTKNINVQGLAAGMYFVKVQTGKDVFVLQAFKNNN
jgi:peptidyl-Asp metalloendopeptidase